MTPEFDEQADLFLAAFWNDNGNVALCRVVFSSRDQALDWAERDLKRHAPRPGELIRSKEGVTLRPARGSELGWRVISALEAGADRDVADISLQHVETLR